MSDISYSYTRIRKEFGRIPEFQANEGEILADIAPNADLKDQYIPVDPYETEVQNIPTLSESSTNTERISLRPHGQVHNEGGWPLGIDPTEFEEKMKYCKKAERDESYFSSCKGLVERCMEKYLKQNNAIDIYGAYFSGSSGQATQSESTEMGPPAAKTVTVFKDPSPVKRTAAALSWLGDGKKLAVAYCNLRFQSKAEGMSTASHIWDVQNPNEPIETLTPASPLCSIEYYGKDPHLIAGGSYNGVVQYWDTRSPLALPPGCHRGLPQGPRVGHQSGCRASLAILSVSTDGQGCLGCRTPEKPVEIKSSTTTRSPCSLRATTVVPRVFSVVCALTMMLRSVVRRST